jgi:hypothetical protein
LHRVFVVVVVKSTINALENNLFSLHLPLSYRMNLSTHVRTQRLSLSVSDRPVKSFTQLWKQRSDNELNNWTLYKGVWHWERKVKKRNGENVRRSTEKKREWNRDLHQSLSESSKRCSPIKTYFNNEFQRHRKIARSEQRRADVVKSKCLAIFHSS